MWWLVGVSGQIVVKADNLDGAVVAATEYMASNNFPGIKGNKYLTTQLETVLDGTDPDRPIELTDRRETCPYCSEENNNAQAHGD